MQTKLVNTFLVILIFMGGMIQSFSQCPMCKMAAESNMKGGGAAGQGLNNGILYLLIIPYAMVGIFFILYRRNRRMVVQEKDI
jgi:hypothetical protein